MFRNLCALHSCGRRIPILVCLLWAGAGMASASLVSYSGNFSYDDDLQLFSVTLPTAQNVAIWTTSFAGGGFAPALSFFDPTGLLLAAVVDGYPGGCTTASPDPATGYCWDAYLSMPDLPAGEYTLALTEDDNTANGPDFSDGFQEGTDNQNNFTGPLFLDDPTRSFILVDGSQRTNAWDLTIETTNVPEPSSVLPLWTILLGLATLRWRARGFTK